MITDLLLDFARALQVFNSADATRYEEVRLLHAELSPLVSSAQRIVLDGMLDKATYDRQQYVESAGRFARLLERNRQRREARQAALLPIARGSGYP